MFGLFENKRPKLTITEDDKNWVEENLLWLGEIYGIQRLLKTPFIYPYYEDFPYKNLRKEEQFVPFFKKLCSVFGLNPDEFVPYKFNKETAQWEEIIKTRLQPAQKIENPFQPDIYKILLEDIDFETIERTVAKVVYYLAIFKLITDGYYKNDEDSDGIVVLAIMYFGFGIFFANGNFLQNGRNKSIITTFPEQAMAYINALICYISGTDFEKVSKLLNSNTQLPFRQNYQYLQNTNNTTLDKATLNENAKLKELYDLINKEKDHNALIVAWDEVLKIRKEDWIPWNNLGYAKLMLGRFEEAAKDFSQAIICDNYAAFPFDNRAFCRLQLGDLEGAFSDIISSLNFDDENAYTWRTLGIYHFLKQEYDQAIEYLEKALTMDKSTDLIHFYMAKLYGAIGDEEKQAYHKQKSIEANETNSDFLAHNRI